MDWLRKHLRPKLTKELLRDQFIGELQKALPGIGVEPSPNSVLTLKVKAQGRESITCFLDNLWANSQGADGDARLEQLSNHVQGIVETLTDTCDARMTNIVPAVKDQQYLNFGDASRMMYEHLAGDLYMIYCIDSPKSITSLSKEDFGTLGIDEDRLRTLAMENLRRILPPIERHGTGPWFLLTAGGDYVASILLLDEVWDELQICVDGDVVAVAPTRDVLLFTGSASAEGIQAIRQKAEELTRTEAHVVSSTLLKRLNNGWTVYCS
jgi:uncharacterized protein YtpQ (UPF0354 family)